MNVVARVGRDVDDLAGHQLEELRLVAGRLHRKTLAVAADEVEPDVEAEGTIRSIITSRVDPFGSSVTSRSCGRTKASPSWCAWPTNVITNSLAGCS